MLSHALAGGRAASQHPAEFLATVWVRLGRLVTTTDWAPSLVCFAHEAPTEIAEHARVKSCRQSARAENSPLARSSASTLPSSIT